jgi:hypothetical protein
MSSALTPIHGACQPHCPHTWQLQLERLPDLILANQKDPQFFDGLDAMAAPLSLTFEVDQRNRR